MSPRARVALVTGASRGLGAAIATALAADGAAVAVNYARDAASADAVVAAIEAAGGRAAAFRADVTDEAEVTSLHQAVVAALGEVDVLVANATGPQPEIGVESLRVDDLLTQFRFFAVSPLLLAQQVLPGMRRRGWGRIVQIGSEAFELGTPGSSAYVAAKGAQLGLTRSWARELGGTGVTVNLVAPGFVPTERHVGVPDADRDRYARGVPMGRLGTADEVAAAVTYLASDRAAFLTGQRIAVNGGNTL
ncbi:3-oxoacyl-ACP reductase [Actinocatenispora thailandica]|uniref:3-oxoacyl-ACP reductase n=1 Tax=Actinocatenispora thailandica TaxID=227318 RepID=A0A7R7HVY8_9ACTN|nr:SDR family oxidoreductase [Actinocatenispora thailandica]BCJ34338.1 3-oxoacyl-ACP reductase [Actinocatenispora thailandica]